MLPEQIYHPQSTVVPEITVVVLRHTDLGDRVTCAHCTVCGIAAKRLTQEIHGVPVNEVPVWNLNGRIVSDWFAEIVEAKYQEAVQGMVIVLEPDFV